MQIRLDTPIIDLHRFKIGRLSQAASAKLASAIAAHAMLTEPANATVADLLSYLPVRYEDRKGFVRTEDLSDGAEASVDLTVRVAGAFQVRSRRLPKSNSLYIFEISATDSEQPARPVIVNWFISGKAAKPVIEYYTKKFARGVRFAAYGKWNWDTRRATFCLTPNRPDEIEILQAAENDTAPETEAETEINSDTVKTVHSGRFVPIYRKLGTFSGKRVREIIYDLLQNIDPESVTESLPAFVIRDLSLPTRLLALKEAHFPPDDADPVEYVRFRSPAQRRLIFEEFFDLSFALLLRRGIRKRLRKQAVIELPKAVKKEIASLLPFKLTEAQRRVIREIFDDLCSENQMHRLIQGDVGSGKTVVAFLAAAAVMENGYQAALMAPTELLAEQHFRNAVKFFEQTGYRIELLTGSLSAKKKQEVRRAAGSGEADFVIGTHALISGGTRFSSLALAIIDEQHRFGVLQRAELAQSGNTPDVLIMSATPIPRSLAMTVYGDLDISVIDELPPGRTPVKTVVVGEDRRSGVYKGIERELKAGRQAYVVYPLIEESESLDLKAASEMYYELKKSVFPHRRVGLLHSRLTAAEKDFVMQRFAGGELDILVSTTVVEVGVDVPNATVMLIEHAERFGLSQLHQLRGRVGRGSDKSFCVLMTGDRQTATARKRLGIMEETSDGFKIAEKDLEIRGEGEIFGTQQSGERIFRIANLVRDQEILAEARKCAQYLLTKRGNSIETNQMIEKINKIPRFNFARIG
ncbi:MAG: ATP-dependent DNA helicase RecG [Pyrinomonadaceae bacterium]